MVSSTGFVVGSRKISKDGLQGFEPMVPKNARDKFEALARLIKQPAKPKSGN